MNTKKIIIAFIAALVIVLAGVVVYNTMSAKNRQDAPSDKQEQITDGAETNNNNSDAADDKASDNAGSEGEEQKVYKPTFMYFVSDSDTDFEKTAALIDELKKEYGDKVTFEINNIDENPEMKDNFPVDGQTPALIMLNTKNDISAFEFKCSQKDRLVECIENALD